MPLRVARSRRADMTKQPLKDNQTYAYKKALRQRAIQELAQRGIDDPAICETHGGAGQLFRVCYRQFKRGVVFEKDPQKTAKLGLQRPTWSVYECDCVQALSEGAGGHLAFDLLDCDPYGQCWEALEAFFGSRRDFAPTMAVVVNDGLRQSLSIGTAWSVKSMQPMVEKYGNDLHPVYLEISEELLGVYAARAGYHVETFAGYYCGPALMNTHWLAILTR